MSPVDAAVVRRKLGHIAASLDALAPLASLTLPEYRQQLYERKAAERLLHEAIEAALDINAHIIAEQGGDVPDDYYSGFMTLVGIGVLPADLAQQLAPSAGLRNRLVHEYEALDDARVLAAIGTIRHLYPEYVRHIEAFLTRATARRERDGE
jgi:uncharacterized protein YutE (UPF0331/DUF86 family)